jgi:hypothetical protein
MGSEARSSWTCAALLLIRSGCERHRRDQPPAPEAWTTRPSAARRERLGEGAMGVVWMARDTAPIARRAWLLHDRFLGDDNQAQLAREARVMARVHPNVVACTTSASSGRTPWRWISSPASRSQWLESERPAGHRRRVPRRRRRPRGRARRRSHRDIKPRISRWRDSRPRTPPESRTRGRPARRSRHATTATTAGMTGRRRTWRSSGSAASRRISR